MKISEVDSTLVFGHSHFQGHSSIVMAAILKKVKESQMAIFQMWSKLCDNKKNS